MEPILMVKKQDFANVIMLKVIFYKELIKMERDRENLFT